MNCNYLLFGIYIYIYIYITWYIYIIAEGQEFIYVFYWGIPLEHEIYTKCKKTSNLIEYLVIIYALELKVNK